MSERFIKYIPSDKAAWFRQHHTALYLLLSLAVERARWADDCNDGWNDDSDGRITPHSLVELPPVMGVEIPVSWGVEIPGMVEVSRLAGRLTDTSQIGNGKAIL